MGDRYAKHYSPTRYNNAVDTLRGIFEVTIDKGLIYRNPPRGVRSPEGIDEGVRYRWDQSATHHELNLHKLIEGPVQTLHRESC
jgi:hypothetical protein